MAVIAFASAASQVGHQAFKPSRETSRTGSAGTQLVGRSTAGRYDRFDTDRQRRRKAAGRRVRLLSAKRADSIV